MTDLSISDFFGTYPSISSPSFNYDIYSKREFYENRLPEIEIKSDEFIALKHQEIISTFLSSQTPYDGILLKHDVGTGKSCTTSIPIERIRQQNEKYPDRYFNTFRKALILNKGDKSGDNYMNELVNVCSGGRYIPENFEELTELEKVHRTKAKLSSFYEFSTFQKIVKSKKRKYRKNEETGKLEPSSIENTGVLSLSDEKIREKYNNTIIVIDEVHNIRPQDDPGVYENIHRFLHTVQNCKIILASGTPAKDSIEEIAPILNLILPLDQQLPTGAEFKKRYLEEIDGIIRIKKNRQEELKSYFKGRVSYLSSMTSNVKKEFVGKKEKGLKYFKVDEDMMSSFQSKSYKEAYEKDFTGKEGVYANSRQASLFVYPDGSYGETGFKKYITAKKGKKIGKEVITTYSMTKELKDILTDNGKAKTNEEKIKILKKYSSKYTKTISDILKGEKELAFCYCEYVEGSGLILFSKILELFGFSKSKGKENSPELRYSIVTNKTASVKQMRKIINQFNKKENAEGDFIRVIIGSRVIGEVFTLKNVQQAHIFTPWYNWSETEQAIARATRLFSHTDIQKIKGSEGVKLKIFLHASIPSGDLVSVDLYMYILSEKKDISLQILNRLLKEASVDCALFYDRNYQPNSGDFSRECNYMNCSYTCDGIPSDEKGRPLPPQFIDNSTYSLYYLDEDKLLDSISAVFYNKPSITLENLISLFDTYTPFEIIKSLNKGINTSRIFYDKYGFPCYLKESNNIYYLDRKLDNNTNFLNSYYSYNPNILANTDYSQIIKPIYNNYYSMIIDKLTGSEEKLRDELVRRLPIEVQEILIESAISAKSIDSVKNTNFREWIFKYFKNYISEENNIWVSSLYPKGPLRCFKDDNWTDCPADFKIKSVISNKEDILASNPLGYYGKYNATKNSFSIRNLELQKEKSRNKKEGDTDTRTVYKGKVCNTWEKSDLLKICLRLKLEVPVEDKMDKDELLNSINKSKYKTILSLFTEKELKDKNLDELQRIIYWSGETKPNICNAIMKYFKANTYMGESLLVEEVVEKK